MKEVFAALGTEVFRPFVTLVVPGAVAITSYFIGLLQRRSDFYRIVNANHTESAFVLIIVMLFAGLVIEDFGARIEVGILDRRANKRTSNRHDQVWNEYLRVAFKVEPAGRRYLRALVMRLKFELGAAVALIMGMPGLFLVEMPVGCRWLSIVGAISLSFYLAFEAGSTHTLLARIREELLKEIKIVG